MKGQFLAQLSPVELESEDQEVVLPNWLGLELTHLKGWSIFSFKDD